MEPTMRTENRRRWLALYVLCGRVDGRHRRDDRQRRASLDQGGAGRAP